MSEETERVEVPADAQAARAGTDAPPARAGAGAETRAETGAEPVIARGKRKPLLIGLALLVAALGLLYLLYAVFIGSRSVSTDNAYVAGDTAEVTPLTSGRITELAVTDTQSVSKGRVLFRIDDADQRIALAQAQADYDQALRAYGQSRKNADALDSAADADQVAIASAQAKLASAEAMVARAKTDFDRRQALVGTGAVSTDEVTAARQAYQTAVADHQSARAGVDQARAAAASARRNAAAAQALTANTTVQTAPQILQAKARLDAAKLDLARTVVRAPVAGVVTNRSVQVGQKVQSGGTAMMIVPVDQLYVNANFKENQLKRVMPGQAALVTSDLYGSGVKFHGKVIGLAGGTGAAFSLIPAQNATGNWIKVVQRLPVRISLDPRELREHPLRVGLSMEAEIDLTSGRR